MPYKNSAAIINNIFRKTLKIMFFSFSDSACYQHQVSSLILNHHSIIHLIISLTLILLQCVYESTIRVLI